MATLEQGKNTVAPEDPRAPKRVLSASEGEALSRRLAEPAHNPTLAMLEAVRAHKRLLSEPGDR